MITVHHLENSRSQRILWLLEELGVTYEIKRYARNTKTMLAPPELKQVHPLGKSPVITDGDLTIAESGAIIEYLVERYGNGRFIPPPGSNERLKYTYWLHYAEGSIMPLMVMSLVFSRIPQPPTPFFIRPLAKLICDQVKSKFLSPQIKTHLTFIESQLNNTTWFAGNEFSAADIQMSFALEAAAVRSNTNNDYPKISAFLNNIHSRPGYQHALEKGGPYALMS